nr:type II toxin-antitoxin system HicB family antitoxin [Pseudomonas moraviensis]
MNVMGYNGFTAHIDYSDEDGLFVGHIAGIKDVVGFHGESVNELRKAFEEAVTNYLETCARLGRINESPVAENLRGFFVSDPAYLDTRATSAPNPPPPNYHPDQTASSLSPLSPHPARDPSETPGPHG